MSRAEDKQAAFDHMVSELRGEGVAISDKTALEVVEAYYSKPLNERISPMPGHEASSITTDKPLVGRAL